MAFYLKAFCLLLIWQVRPLAHYANFDTPKIAKNYHEYILILNKLRTMIDRHVSSEDYVLPLSATVWTSYSAFQNRNFNLASRYLFQYPISFFGDIRFKNGELQR